MDEDEYIFHIDAYSPETIPMTRLAEYMAVLAAIFGEKDSVHFKGLQGGSTKVVSRVQREAVPKVRENINDAQSGDGNQDSIKAYKQANEMLRNDNAAASLECAGTNVLDFPGKKIPRPPKLGPFNQGVEKDGVLVRIGGVDKSAHATIEDGDGKTWSFEVNRELAVEIAHHLFGNPIRLKGTGRFFRDNDGLWQNTSLKGASFHELNPDSLFDVVEKLRQISESAWTDGKSPLLVMRSLRDDDSAVD